MARQIKHLRILARPQNLAVAVVIAGVAVAVAISRASAQDNESRPDSDQPEEVVVYAKKSLQRLRFELHRAEENVFKLFNALNSDDEFDIHCRDEAHAGTRIKRRVCKPNYARALRSQATADWLESGQANATDGQPFMTPTAQLQQKEKQMREEMESLVIQNPDFFEAVTAYESARQIFIREKEKRCKDGRAACR